MGQYAHQASRCAPKRWDKKPLLICTLSHGAMLPHSRKGAIMLVGGSKLLQNLRSTSAVEQASESWGCPASRPPRRMQRLANATKQTSNKQTTNTREQGCCLVELASKHDGCCVVLALTPTTRR